MSIRPADDILQEPYWKHLAEGRLALQRCTQCGTFRHPPSEICHRCHSFGVEWTEVSGKGSLYSFTVARHSVHASLDAKVPYAIALVQLDEGPRIVSGIPGALAKDLRIGMRLACRVTPVSDGFALPYFHPVSEEST
ncbi:Zn-ribbon domain-containing OB-fold protein [Ramlibacter sp.]|uniref:Zn-ribbon domain-containing OB-fold protein n=1 Tax=Ramlibacter sp. TaxID=1917967 RepID=UPI003D111A03